MKSRGCYETPGGTILLKAHRAIESLTLDREVGAPEGRADAALRQPGLQRLLVEPGAAACCRPPSTRPRAVVNGVVRLKLYKGGILVVGRKSDTDSLFDAAIATFEEDAGAYNQADATGFIRLNALRLRVAARRRG